MQNHVFRVISNAVPYTGMKCMHDRMSLCILTERRLFDISGFMFKLEKGKFEQKHCYCHCEKEIYLHNKGTHSQIRDYYCHLREIYCIMKVHTHKQGTCMLYERESSEMTGL